MCAYDVVWAREKVPIEYLNPYELSKVFKSREICKNFFGDNSLLVRIIVFKPVLLEEDTIFLEKPYIWQNLRKFITIVDFFDDYKS